MTDLSLYFHIPYCSTKCGYCDFYSITDTTSCQSVLDAMIDELRYEYHRLGPLKIPTIFIGGGTPNSIPVRELGRFIKSIANLIDQNVAEWTIEANPEFISDEFLQLLNDTPVNRLSIGVQSFQEKYLKILERNTDASTSIRNVEKALSIYKGDINIDLMCEIPRQSLESSIEDLRTAIKLDVYHISRYSLTIEEGTEFSQKYSHDSVENTDVYYAGIEYLSEQGYRRYEVSNFAKPGNECLHNIRYWNIEPYLGCGPSAVSTIDPRNNGKFLWRRRTHPKSVKNYIEIVLSILSGNNSEAMLDENEWEYISWKDFCFELFIMGLRLVDGIDAAKLKKRLPEKYFEVCVNTAEALNDYLVSNDGFIRLKPAYFDKQNEVLVKILEELDREIPCP